MTEFAQELTATMSDVRVASMRTYQRLARAALYGTRAYRATTLWSCLSVLGSNRPSCAYCLSGVVYQLQVVAFVLPLKLFPLTI